MTIVPISLSQANAVVARWHRHHKPVVGQKFSVGIRSDDPNAPWVGPLHGVAIAGRPVSRILDDGFTLEVTRCATDGTKNACSMLYAATIRAARALGYRRWQTYTLPEEGGASLRAVGAKLVAKTDGGSWDCPSRRRMDKAPTCPKWRWEIAL